MQHRTRCRATVSAAHHAEASSLKRNISTPGANGCRWGQRRRQTAANCCPRMSCPSGPAVLCLVCSSAAAAAAAAAHPAFEPCLLTVAADACPRAEFRPSAYVSVYGVTPRWHLRANASFIERHRSISMDTCKFFVS